jgi:Protein kinase domain
LYLVRTGSVTIQSDKGETKTVRSGGYFGEDQLKADVGAKDYKVGSVATCVPSYTVIAGAEDVTCGVLTVTACRKVLNTRCIGKPEAVSRVMYDSIVDKGVPLKSLKRHAVLGAGTFGMVFLVSRETTSGERVAYALKVQSKYELCKDGQAAAVVDEKNIMANLHHPFLIGLVNTYQDENFVYILLQLVQGGELYSYMHTPKRDFLREDDAQFYAACIADGLVSTTLICCFGSADMHVVICCVLYVGTSSFILLAKVTLE